MLLALFAIVACGGSADLARAQGQACTATAADLQSLRNNLETVRVQVQAARNETGYEKAPATQAIATTIRTLEETVGHPITPSPDSQIVRTPRSAIHPHMQVIQQAFAAARRDFEKARCALPRSGEPMQKAMADLDRALQFR